MRVHEDAEFLEGSAVSGYQFQQRWEPIDSPLCQKKDPRVYRILPA